MTEVSSPISSSPISRVFVVANLAEDGETAVAIAASADECVALARRLDAPAVREFSADFRIAARKGGRVRVEGEVRAVLTQICVVTLDPFEATVSEPVVIEFAPEAKAAEAAARATAAHEPPPGETIADQPDPPDPIIDGRIDLGAVATEFLALALDPYPRKPGAAFDAPQVEAGPDSPFAALGRLKQGET